MREILRVTGGCRLEGNISVSGGKNAAVAIIPAALLAKEPSTIENVPDIEDVHVLLEMLRWVGAKTEFRDNTVWVDPRVVDRSDPPADLAGRMRASYYMAPVLLGRLHQAKVPLPGGCDIGRRPIDQTVKGMNTIGANVCVNDGILEVSADYMEGGEVFLEMPSVGATVNCMLTAVSADGPTAIHNAAREPHIVDLANFLASMGASIRGAGTDTIRINGGRALHGTSYAIVPDQIETGTLMIAAAAAGTDVTIHGVIPTHLEPLMAKLLEMGAKVSGDDDWIRVRSSRDYRAVKVKTQGYPGFPTDLQQPLSALLTTAAGTSTVTETVFEDRFRFVNELRKMGADITVIDGTVAKITGVDHLTGARVQATDLRAGAAMVVAALMAEGITEIDDVHFILRGYEKLDEKLNHIGAKIEHIFVPDENT